MLLWLLGPHTVQEVDYMSNILSWKHKFGSAYILFLKDLHGSYQQYNRIETKVKGNWEKDRNRTREGERQRQRDRLDLEPKQFLPHRWPLTVKHQWHWDRG